MDTVRAGQKAVADAAPRPLHNAALLTVASFAAKGCGFVMLLVAARVLGKDGIGDYGMVMAFVGLFAVGMDLGLSTLAVRDVAQDPALLPRYLGNVLALRLALALVMATACITLAIVLHYSAVRTTGIALWALALLPIAVVSTTGIAFQAIERMAAFSALTAATAALTAGLGIAVLLLGGRVVALIAVATAVNGAAALAALALTIRVVGGQYPVDNGSRQRGSRWRAFLTAGYWHLDTAWWPALLRAALPFAALTVLNVLYSRADTVLVGSIKGSGDAGLYTVAYRVVDTLLVVAISPFNAAALPAFNRIAAASREALQRLVVSGVRIMLALGLPVAVAVTVYAREVLQVVGGRAEYLAAIPAVQWLAWSFPCFTVLAILYNALYAAHRANDVAATFGVALLFNVGLNLALIPRYSYFASAALTTASEALNVALAAWAVYRHVGVAGSQLSVVRRRSRLPASGYWLLATAVAALAMGLVMWLLQPLGPVPGPLVGLPAGALIYLLAIRYLRVLGEPERAILARLPLAGRYARWL